MKSVKIIVCFCCIVLCACASGKTSREGFVEIENSRSTEDPGAPTTIWVPRSYVESGPLRGMKLVEKGVDRVAAGLAPAKKNAALSLNKRIALIEIGRDGLAQAVYRNLRQASAGVVLDPAQTVLTDQSEGMATRDDKARFAERLQRDHRANVAVYITSTAVAEPGQTALIEVYDTMAGGLLDSFQAPLPPASNEPSGVDRVAAALKPACDRIAKLLSLLPWYGRVIEVEGDRAYIGAGRESCLAIGQSFTVYRGGRFIKGAGFSPGEKVGTVSVSGFVGPDASFGAITEGRGVQAGDVVSAE